MNIPEAHHSFSCEYPLGFFSDDEKILFSRLEVLRQEHRFPAIKNDIGYFFNFLVNTHKISKVYEFGSGYGQSCFWYLMGGGSKNVKKVYLNEIKPKYKDIFQSIDWPNSWLEKIDYYEGDAFDNLPREKDIDFLLIDGHKSDYLKFIDFFKSYMSVGGFILIDNAFWKGSVVIDGLVTKKSQAAIRELHSELKSRLLKEFSIRYLPFEDGLVLLQKL